MKHSSIKPVNSQSILALSGCVAGGERREPRDHGGVAALDLYNGHLNTVNSAYSDIPLQSPRFLPLNKNGLPVSGWFGRPESVYNQSPFVAKIQPFKAGGYEVTISPIDIERVGSVLDGLNNTGKREKGEQKANDIVRSKQRAKTQVRYLIKSIGCDRLLTLSIREGADNFTSLDEWSVCWAKFKKLCSKALGHDLHYVAVPEKHTKGNYHLHVAIAGHINIKMIRRFWYMALGGRGNEAGAFTPGQVDISFKKHLTRLQRLSGCARYVSKYIVKQDDIVEFNKKRYWSSKHNLPDVRRYVLSGVNVYDALNELFNELGLDIKKIYDGKSVFVFPNQFGAWFSFDESFALPIPF